MEEKYSYLADQAPLNQVQYATKDYPSYFDALLRRIRDEFGDIYTDYGSSSTGMLLTNIMAYGLSQLAWYNDRSASDCFLDTARTLTPVTRLARQIGYKVKPAAASTTDLEIQWADPTTAPGTIQAGFRFTGPGGLQYVATASVIVPIGSTSATVNVTEGSLQSLNFTGNGNPSQRYNLKGVDGETTYVADTSVRVFVNGLEWDEVQFLDFEQTNQFEVVYTTVPPFVQFGDGFAGNIPPDGADIRIDYTVIRGAGGNVKSNTITKADDVFQVAGSAVPFTSVTNPVGSSGGSPPQSIASVKALAPKVFQSRGAAITQQDYEALTSSFTDPTYGAVAVGFAACIRDEFLDSELSTYINDAQKASDDWLASVVQLVSDVNAQIGVGNAAVVNTSALWEIVNAVNTQVFVDASTISINAQTIRNSCTVALGALELAASNQTAVDSSLAAALATPGVPVAAQDLINEALGYSATASANVASAKIEVDTFEALAGEIDAKSFSIYSVEVPKSAGAYVGWTGSAAPLVASQRDILTGALDQIGSILTTFSTLSSLYSGSINDNLQSVEDWLIAYFSNDCKSNIVNVKILVKNSDGFYTGPSTGLVTAVQAYLDSVKEVTHQVFVTSGSDALLAAGIDIKVQYDPAFVKAEVRSNLEAGIDAILKDRTFKTPLYLSDLYNISDGIDGIVRANIEITGPATRIDTNGNLIPQELEIVTKGTITITEVGA